MFSSLSFYKMNMTMNALKRRKEQSNSYSSNQSLELQRYLQQPTYDFDEENDGAFEILGWWKIHQKQYPLLSIVARDVLIILV